MPLSHSTEPPNDSGNRRLCRRRQTAGSCLKSGRRNRETTAGRSCARWKEGRSFVVTRNGRPVGELRPLRRDRFVAAAVAVQTFGHGPGVDWERLRGDLDEVIEQRVDPRA